MKKHICFLSVACCAFYFFHPLQAQETGTAAKLFYVEQFGPGIIMSVNFDSRFVSGERLGVGYRAGIGYGVEKYEDQLGKFFNQDYPDVSYLVKARETVYTIPVGLNYVFGRPGRVSSFEAGAGITFLTKKVSLYNYELDKPGYLTGYLTFMYRHTPLHSGISFRAGFTPVIGTAGDLYPMVAVSLGYAF